MNNILDDIDIENNLYNSIYPSLNNGECSKYYKTDEFNELNFNQNSDFLLLNFNIRSLSANLDQFLCLNQILNKQFDVLCFTESWLRDENKQLYTIDNFNDFHNLRNDGRRGGGISIFISKSYDAKIIKKHSIIHKCIETLFIEITRNNKKILIAAAYKPNKSDDQFFIDKISNFLNNSQKLKYDEIILTGDFNFDLLKYEENGTTLNFLNSLSALSLIPVISKPTRVTDSTATLIDNIFILNPINFTSGIIVSDISDHFPIFINIKKLFIINNNNNSNIKIEYHIINENTIENFIESISAYDFSFINDSSDLSSDLDQLTDVIDDAYKTCCPLKVKTISQKASVKPWISDKIITLINKRHHYYLLYRKNIISKNTYSNFRNSVTKAIRKSKKKYYENKFNKVKNNIRETWRIINHVLKPKFNKKGNSVKQIIINNKIHENPDEISNLFNEFFVNIGRDIAESVDSGPDDHKKYLSHINVPNSFFFKPVLPNETCLILNSLKNKPGNINKVPIQVLKSINNIISIPLTIIINKSLTSGIFPDSLKIARITPIYKEGSRSDINNYRPISVLPTLSKIFEKLVYKQLYNYLEINSSLVNIQFGFRTRKSTTQAILHFMQYLYKNLDEGKLVFSIFLDFRKAFDSVNHAILLSKLEKYGIRGHALDWFRSYLTNRKQFTFINNVSSNLNLVKYGVPQGSILDPLFIFKYILYADDSVKDLPFLIYVYFYLLVYKCDNCLIRKNRGKFLEVVI